MDGCTVNFFWSIVFPDGNICPPTFYRCSSLLMQPHVPCGAAAGARGFGSGSSLCCLHSLGVGIRVALLSNPAALVSLDVLTKMGRTCLRSYPTNRCQPLPFEWSHIVGLNFRAVGLPMSLRTCGSCWSSWQCLQDSPGLRTLVELGPKTGTCFSKVNPPFVQGPYFLELFTQPLVSRAPLHVEVKGPHCFGFCFLQALQQELGVCCGALPAV